MKKNKMIYIFLVIIFLFILSAFIYFVRKKTQNVTYDNNYNQTYSYLLDESYFLEEKELPFNQTFIKNEEEYQDLIHYYNISNELSADAFKNYNYIVDIISIKPCAETINGIKNINISNEKVTITIGYDGGCRVCNSTYSLLLIPIPKNALSDAFEIENDYVLENQYDCYPIVVYKPLLYLYPQKTTNVTVKLLKHENLTATYPKYEDDWNVLAYPNGDLIDLKTNRSLYGLYWEGITNQWQKTNVGFVIKGEDTISFLEEKLAILGLTEREANEFIIYWLPKLERNTYNYIRFVTLEEINASMPLEITPVPDTLIRVLMIYQGLEEKIDVKEQMLETPLRTGFTVVEWGGTEIV